MVFTSGNDCSLSTKQIQKQVVSLKSLEAYLPIDVNYVGAVTKGSTWKINARILGTAGISASVGPWLSEQSSLTYLGILSVKTRQKPSTSLYAAHTQCCLAAARKWDKPLLCKHCVKENKAYDTLPFAVWRAQFGQVQSVTPNKRTKISSKVFSEFELWT